MDPVNAGAPLHLAAAAIGAVRLGIPVDSVVQAIPLPAAPAMLPRRQGALRCLVEHDGALVPVVDLARWVDLGTAPDAGTTGQAGARILILREAGRTIGLQVDAVDGLVEVPASAIARLHHDDHPEEVFHSAAHLPDTGHILSLLDVGRLADLAACWHQAAPGAAHDTGAPVVTARAVETRPYALLQAGAIRLGVPAGELVEVIAMPALARFGGGIDNAYCVWRGRHLPLLPARALPGLPQADDAPLLAIVEHEGLALGVPAQAALALQDLAGGASREAGATTSVVYDSDGAAVHLLDTAALFACFPEALLSKPGAALAASRGQHDGGARNDSACIVFAAGTLSATPIASVEQILPLGPQAAGAPLAATMEWQGAAIALVDLRPAAAAAAGGHVLVACEAGRPVGYVVTRVQLLVPAGSARQYRMGTHAGRPVEFITVDAAAGQASYRIVDLAQAAVDCRGA